MSGGGGVGGGPGGEGEGCWTCGGSHPSGACPHKISIQALPTPKTGTFATLLLPDDQGGGVGGDGKKKGGPSPKGVEAVSTAGGGGNRLVGRAEARQPQHDEDDTDPRNGQGGGHVQQPQAAVAATSGSGANAAAPQEAPVSCSSHHSKQATTVGGGGVASPPTSPIRIRPPNLLPQHTAVDDDDDSSLDGSEVGGSRAGGAGRETVKKRTVSWAGETCVVEEQEGGQRTVQKVPIEHSLEEHNAQANATMTRSGRNYDFTVDTGRLSLLTLRYVVAQMWALTQIRLALTLLLSGLAIEGIRFWQVSLPILLLLVSTIYINQHQKHVRAGRSDSEAWLWAVDAWCSSEVWRERIYEAFKQSFKDKNRVRMLLLLLQVLPVNLQIYSLTVLTLRMHQYPSLAFLTFVYLSVWLVASKTILPCKEPGRRIRIAKIGVFAISLTYLLIRQEWECFLRLVAPALITFGCVLFLTLPSQEVEVASRSAVTLMLKDVMVMANERLVTEHELIQIALNRWLLEYWDNPSDFTWEDFLPMMKYVFKTMRSELPESILPTLQTLQKRMEDLHTDPLGPALVRRIRTDVSRIAPHKRFAVLLILSRATRHLLVLLFAVITMAVFMPQYRTSLPFGLLPLILGDVMSIDKRGPKILHLLSPAGTESEGLSMLLNDSDGLLGVWNNLNQALVACETGLSSQVKVLAHSDRAEVFIGTMKAYQTMALARITPPTAAQREWNFKAGWAMIELNRLRSSKVYQGLDGTDFSAIYRRAMGLYGEWLVDAPGHFNQWLHSLLFTVTRAAVPFSARSTDGSSSVGSLGSFGSMNTGQPFTAAKTPVAGTLVSLTPWSRFRDNQFFSPGADPLNQSMSIPVEAMPTPTSSSSSSTSSTTTTTTTRSTFWWVQAGGDTNNAPFPVSSPETDDDDNNNNNSNSMDGSHHHSFLSGASSGGSSVLDHSASTHYGVHHPNTTNSNHLHALGGGKSPLAMSLSGQSLLSSSLRSCNKNDRIEVTIVKGLFNALGNAPPTLVFEDGRGRE